MSEWADYVVNIKEDGFGWDPIEAFYTPREAKDFAWAKSKEKKCFAEVVYMPCNDMEANEVIYRCFNGENTIKIESMKFH